MPERYVTPQPDVAMLDPETGNPALDPEGKPYVSKWSEIMLRVLAHPKLCGNTPALKSNNLIRRKLKSCTVSVPFGIPEEDWQRFTAVLNDPDTVGSGQGQQAQNMLAGLVRFTPSVLPQLEEFFTAWTEAPTKMPEPKPAEQSAASEAQPQLPPATPAA